VTISEVVAYYPGNGHTSFDVPTEAWDCEGVRQQDVDSELIEEYCDDEPVSTGTEEHRVGTIQLYNRTSCSRHLRINVRDGHIDEEDQRSFSTTLAEGEEEEVEFVGRISMLDLKHGDIDIQIEQRSAEEAARDACHEGSDLLSD